MRFIAVDDKNALWRHQTADADSQEDDQKKILEYIYKDYFGGRNEHGTE